MDDKEYIRKAVEIANGWSLAWDGFDTPFSVYVQKDLEQPYIDALAAQLVRQVDVLNHAGIEFAADERASVWIQPNGTVVEHYSGDRTMNVIKAIVDSEVVEQ